MNTPLSPEPEAEWLAKWGAIAEAPERDAIRHLKERRVLRRLLGESTTVRVPADLMARAADRQLRAAEHCRYLLAGVLPRHLELLERVHPGGLLAKAKARQLYRRVHGDRRSA